jgi:hypothetical protein
MYDQKRSIYSKGIIANWKEVFCEPVPPSLIDFRAFADDKTAAMHAKKNKAEAEASQEQRHITLSVC